MSTTVTSSNQSNYCNDTEMTCQGEEYEFRTPDKFCDYQNQDSIEARNESRETKKKEFREAPARKSDNNDNKPKFSPNPTKPKDYETNKFKEAPAKAKDHDDNKPHFNPAPAKVRDNSKFKEAPAKAKDNNNIPSPSAPPSNNNNSQTSSTSEDYSKKSGAELLSAFRNGDEKLLKALNENPALMQKLIDQMHMEERHIELISNYNKSKDDALKTIIHNMK